MVEVAYFAPAPEGRAPVKEAPLGMLLPLWALIAANVYFGIDAELTATVAEGQRHSPSWEVPHER